MGTNNAINVSAAGLVKYDGSSTFTGVTVTQHDLLIGASSNGITSVAPSATSGVPVISQGASADPIFGTAVVAGGGTGNTSATAYAVLCGGTTTTAALQSIASVGTSGQVLTSNGASALPTFQAAASGGALVKISTLTASNQASVSFTSAISGTYTTYLLSYNNVQPITTNALFQMLVSSNNGSSYIATNYQSGIQNWIWNNTTDGNINSTTYIPVNNGITNSTTTSGQIWFTTAAAFTAWGSSTIVAGGNLYSVLLGAYNTSTSVNAIQFSFASGNINTGTFTLYGLVQ